MVEFIGRNGNLALFSNGAEAVVVNTDLNLVVGVGEDAVLSSAREWDATDETFEPATLELASGAVTTLDIKVITAAGGRAYTVPDGVKAEAKKALEWRKEHKRGGTPVGLNTARTLARGGQIGIEKIRHIAKYFPRHEVDKKGKGWKAGDDQFPSNGRIAWALWGGDAAWRWAKAIVERENKKAVTATGYVVPGYSDSVDTYKMVDAYDSDLDAFKQAHELDPNYGPEFMARVRMDGSGIDRLYKVDINGKVCVWDDGRWDDMGHVDGDVWTYDNALDEPYDHCEKDHFVIDPESAIYISARMQQSPHGYVPIEELDPEEASLFANAAPEEDWGMVDHVIAASGALVAFIGSDTGKDSKPKGAVKSGDGQYTSAERSSIATGAPRDATGKFAKAGGRAVVGGDRTRGAGVITGRSATPGNILFKSDVSGQVMDIPAKFTVPEAEAPQTAPAPAANPAQGAPLDVSGVLGEPRMAQGSVGQLPGTMKQLSPADISQALNDWGSYVEEARASFTGKATDNEVRQYAKDTGQKIREVPTVTEGKATTLRDGKFVVESVPSAPVSEDMNPDNAPAAAPAAAPANRVGRASVPRMEGGDSAPAPSTTDTVRRMPAKPGEGKGVKTLPAEPGKKAMPRTMPATKPAPAKKAPRNVAPEQTPRKPTPRNVPNAGKNPDRLSPTPRSVPNAGKNPDRLTPSKPPVRSVPNAGKNPDRITPSKPRTPGKDAVERGTNSKGTNFVKPKPVPRGAAPEQQPRVPGKPSPSDIGRINKSLPSGAPKNGGKKIIGYEPLPGSPNMARPIYGDDKPTKTPIPWPKPAPDVEVSGPSNRPEKPKPKPEAPKPAPKKPAPKPTPKPKPEPEKPKPEEPETPVTPEEPTEPPVTPEEPETPPTEPETPEEPTTPEEPVEPPVTPEEPKPEEPKKPAPPKKKPAPPKDNKPAPKKPAPPKKAPHGALPMPETDRNPGPKKGGDIVGYEPLPGSPNMAKPIYGDLTKSIKNPSTGKTTPIQVSPGPDAVERGTNTKGTNFKNTKPDAVERGTNTKGGGKPNLGPRPTVGKRAPEQAPRVPTKRGKAGTRKRTNPGTVGPIL